MPISSMIIFALIGFITMLAQPVIMVWAQRTLPQFKSVVSGFINGFCWGIIALCMSFLGIIAQKDLLVEGTLEEFEKLFEGKIIRKIK